MWSGAGRAWAASRCSDSPTARQRAFGPSCRLKFARQGAIEQARSGLPMRRAIHIALDAYWRFLVDDGWAIASHIALSALMAMFPFFIVLTSLAGLIFGSADLADVVAKLM